MELRKLRSQPARRRRRAGSLAVAGLLLGGAAALARRLGLDRRIPRPDGGVGTQPSALPQPGESTGPHEPSPSNYDVGGPPANTATHVPVPPPAVPSPIDEEAEADAAAAEAAGIGGDVSPYATDDGLALTDEEERPLLEGGEGVQEGMEQAEGELAEAAEPSDTASPYQKQIDDAIEQQDDPLSGERGEALDALETPLDPDQPGDDLGASVTGASSDAAQGDSGEPDPEEWSEPGGRA